MGEAVLHLSKVVLDYKLGQIILENRLFFGCLFEIIKALTNSSQCILLCKNFSSLICNLLSFSAATFHFEVFFTKNTTLQVSVDGFKVSVVRLREVSVL